MFNPYWQDEDGYLRFEFANGMVFAHAEVNGWNRRIKTKCLAMWEEAKLELKELGYEEVLICIPIGDEKLIKFERLFGFIKRTARGEYLVMSCSTEEN